MPPNRKAAAHVTQWYVRSSVSRHTAHKKLKSLYIYIYKKCFTIDYKLVYNLLCKALDEAIVWLDSVGWHVIPACSVNSELDYGQGSLYTNDCRQGHISLSFSQSCEHSNRQSAEVVAPANDSISRAPTAQETYFISKRSSGTETNEKSEAAAEDRKHPITQKWRQHCM